MPNEIMATIVDMVPFPDLPNFSQVSRQLRSNALARQWRTLDTDLALKKLLHYESEERQEFANLVHELFIEPEETDNVDRRADYLARVGEHLRRPQDDQQRAKTVHDAYARANGEAEVVRQRLAQLLEVFTLEYPALQKVVVQYSEWTPPADTNTPITPLEVDRLIQPALRELSLGSEMVGNIDYDAYRAVSNVLPLLNKTNTPSLQKLKLCLNVVDATDEQLLTALQACPNITSLTLARNLAGLFNDKILEHLATGCKLVTFATSAPIEEGLFETWIPKTPTLQPIFTRLEEFDFPISEVVADQLFPFMTKLRSVRLRLQQVDNILSSLHLLPNLVQLALKSEIWHFPLTRQWLRPLQDLKLETLCFEQRIGQANFYVEDLELQDISSIFGNQQTLKNLSVAFGSSNNPTFLQDDVSSAVREIIVHYPNLTALSLPLPCGTLDLMEMSDEPLQSKITHLNFWRLETPPGSFDSTSLAYKLDCYKLAIKLAEHFPHLEQLTANQTRADVLLTPTYLGGLQNIRLTYLTIDGEGDSNFNGIMITPNDIDTLFGSHATLLYLNVSWQGDTDPQVNPSFLQHRPRLLIERVLANYRVLQTLEMPAPCGAVNLKRLPAGPLNGTIDYLSVASMVPPRTNKATHPVAYNTEILQMACQLIKHFPDLEDLDSHRDEAFVEEVWRDYETMKRAGL
ncbi:hypothetical protein KCU68_g939, partial [Aureobasidium melanogenum]